MNNNNTYLCRKEAAEFIASSGLPCSYHTLGKLAHIGGGPAFRKFGNRALYTRDDLQAWANSKLSAPRLSTSGGAV